jgi:hypothetical protein
MHFILASKRISQQAAQSVQSVWKELAASRHSLTWPPYVSFQGVQKETRNDKLQATAMCGAKS